MTYFSDFRLNLVEKRSKRGLQLFCYDVVLRNVYLRRVKVLSETIP